MRRLKLRYQHKVALLVIMFTSVPLILFGRYYMVQSEELWTYSILAEPAQNVADAVGTIDKLLLQCMQKSYYITSNQQIRSFVSKSKDSDLVNKLTFIEYLQVIISAISADNDMLSLRLYSVRNPINLGNNYRSADEFRRELSPNEEYLPEQIQALGETDVLWGVRSISRTRNETAAPNLCLYRKIENLNVLCGFVELAIPVDYLQSILPGNLPDEAFLAFFAELNRELVCVAERGGTNTAAYQTIVKAYIETGVVPGYRVISESIWNMSGQICYFMPEARLSRQIKSNRTVYYIIFVAIYTLLLCVVEIVTFFFMRKITGIINKIARDIDSISEENQTGTYSEDDELQKIGVQIHGLIRQSKESFTKIQQYEEEKVRLELELLQMRFNPHFLYNTLGTIRILVKDKAIRSSIDSMISYYRIVLNKGNIIIDIPQEIQLIVEFVRLQKFSYGMDFDFKLEIDQKAKEYKIIKHLLQPIVENALFHGIQSVENGALSIKARMDSGDIVFEITDNGVGMNQEAIDRLLSGTAANTTKGYGMYNVQKRIHVYYGAEYGLKIYSEPSVGTKVVMRIPAVKEIPD